MDFQKGLLDSLSSHSKLKKKKHLMGKLKLLLNIYNIVISTKHVKIISNVELTCDLMHCTMQKCTGL